MTIMTPGLDSTTVGPLDAPPLINPSLAHGAYDATALTAGTPALNDRSADKHLGNVTLVDDGKCEPAQGFWSRLGNALYKITEDRGLADSGMPIPDEKAAKACPAEAPVRPAAETPVRPAAEAPLPGAEQAPPMNDIGKDQPTVRLGDTSAPGQGDGQTAKVQPGPTQPEKAESGPAQPDNAAPGKTQPGQENLNPLLKGVPDNIGKHVQELEPGINPRLGCVRMVAHAMHEADPSFPETNNAEAFRKALAAHGYEAVTVKPGDPALGQSQPGDVLVGRRPDGMPSHAAINMGDGHVFNNNSDSGQGQIDSLNQFNQGMHDSKGHWMKNGFSDVTIYRKKADASPPVVSVTGTAGDTIANA
jgi:hypothetical protein